MAPTQDQALRDRLEALLDWWESSAIAELGECREFHALGAGRLGASMELQASTRLGCAGELAKVLLETDRESKKKPGGV